VMSMSVYTRLNRSLSAQWLSECTVQSSTCFSIPTSEVGYTSATTGRGDHKVHKGHVVALEREREREREKLMNIMSAWKPRLGSTFIHFLCISASCCKLQKYMKSNCQSQHFSHNDCTVLHVSTHVQRTIITQEVTEVNFPCKIPYLFYTKCML
jgi:hypothetical protein